MSSQVSQQFGPGVWFLLHQTSKEAKTIQKKLEFLDQLKLVKERFPCLQCRAHMVEYCRQHPPEKSWSFKENGEDLGLFRWTWEFHNAVNARLGKPLFAWQMAKEMYKDGATIGVCAENCDAGSPSQNIQEIQERSIFAIPPKKHTLPSNTTINSIYPIQVHTSSTISLGLGKEKKNRFRSK